MNTLNGTLLCGTILAINAAIVSPAAGATDSFTEQAAVGSTEANEDLKLEEIVVTAQRRQENLQKVPISVTSFDSETLNNAGVMSLIEIGQVDSSASFTSNTGTVIPYVRGLGNSAANIIGNEASVPVYIDDVYYTRLSPAFLELSNVQRVEILKGPQGTLFGRNSSGGAIQIFTRDPGQELALNGKIGYGRFDTVYGSAYLGGGIAENVTADFSASALNQSEGWGRNLTSGEEVGTNRFVNLRGKILFEPAATTRIRLIGYYASMRTSQGLNNDVYEGTVSGTPPFPPYGPSQPLLPLPDIHDSRNTRTNTLRNEGGGGSLKIEQDLGFAGLASISAYRKQTEAYDPVDGDGSAFNFLNYRLKSTDRQLSQEVQLKSPNGSAIKWIIGAFYLDSRQGYTPSTVTGDAITSQGLSELRIFGLQRIKSISGYGQSTFPIDTATNITLGLRYTSDEVRGEGSQEAVIPGVGIFPAQTPYDRTFRFNKLTYRAAVDHQLSGDILAYASVSRGYKSGTFNTLPLVADPTRPETVDAYELGVKSEWLGGRLRLNGAIFQSDVKNPQVSTVITNGAVSTIGLTNANKARIRGGELNVEALLAEGLRLTAGATYLDATYLDFPNAPVYLPNPLPPFGLLPPIAGDARGNHPSQVPELRFDLGLGYEVTTSAGDFSLNTNWAYTGKYFWDPDNAVSQKSVSLVNASLSFQPASASNLTVRLWGKNLLDSEYYIQHQELAGNAGHLGGAAAPRTYGIELNVEY